MVVVVMVMMVMLVGTAEAWRSWHELPWQGWEVWLAFVKVVTLKSELIVVIIFVLHVFVIGIMILGFVLNIFSIVIFGVFKIHRDFTIIHYIDYRLWNWDSNVILRGRLSSTTSRIIHISMSVNISSKVDLIFFLVFILPVFRLFIFATR